MPKLYAKTITSCADCPNVLIVPTISSDILSWSERRCKAVIYRNSVYRLIHWHEPGTPVWCPLKDAEPLPLPF
jgi:hypothetical protein